MAESTGKATTSEEINRLIAANARAGTKITLDDVRGHRAVAVGLAQKLGVVVEGDAGDFLAAFNAGALVLVKGSVGSYLGYGISAGVVKVVGGAGRAAGALATGGEVHVFADAGPFAGWRMAGGLLAVKGDAGEDAGAGMSGGELLVLGKARGVVGRGMAGGAIFARVGTSLDGACARAYPLDAAAAARLKDAVAAAFKGTVVDPAAFVRITSTAAPPPAATPPAGAAPRGAKVTVARAVPRAAQDAFISSFDEQLKGGA